MKLVKATKNHLIYELSKTEQNTFEVDNGFKYVLFLKEDYEDCKPTFKDDIGWQDYETDTLEEAIEFSLSYYG